MKDRKFAVYLVECYGHGTTEDGCHARWRIARANCGVGNHGSVGGFEKWIGLVFKSGVINLDGHIAAKHGGVAADLRGGPKRNG